jgi:hypothetical protein
MLQHIGYLHGVTGQPRQCSSSCREDEYRYYYKRGWHMLQGKVGQNSAEQTRRREVSRASRK